MTFWSSETPENLGGDRLGREKYPGNLGDENFGRPGPSDNFTDPPPWQPLLREGGGQGSTGRAGWGGVRRPPCG